MNRRKFFEFVGKALGAVAITPILPPVGIEQSEPKEGSRSPEPKHWKWDGLGNAWKSDNGEDWEQVARAELEEWEFIIPKYDPDAEIMVSDYNGNDTPEPLGVIDNVEATVSPDEKAASFEYRGYLVPEEYRDALIEHDVEEEALLRSGYFGAGSSGLSAPITYWSGDSWNSLTEALEVASDSVDRFNQDAINLFE